MRILAIDTSTETCGVALCQNGHVTVELIIDHGRTHARVLMEAVRAVLAMGGAGLDQVDALAVTCGPGSFTGLRIGISTAKGLAMGSGKPLVGISTLRCLAIQADRDSDLVCPMIDARRQEVYWALYRRNGAALEPLEPEQVGPLARIIERVDRPCAFIGSGARAYDAELTKNPYARLPQAKDRHRLRPGGVAGLAGQILADGDRDDFTTVAPVYLRPSDAERNRPSA